MSNILDISKSKVNNDDNRDKIDKRDKKDQEQLSLRKDLEENIDNKNNDSIIKENIVSSKLNNIVIENNIQKRFDNISKLLSEADKEEDEFSHYNFGDIGKDIASNINLRLSQSFNNNKNNLNNLNKIDKLDDGSKLNNILSLIDDDDNILNLKNINIGSGLEKGVGMNTLKTVANKNNFSKLSNNDGYNLYRNNDNQTINSNTNNNPTSYVNNVEMLNNTLELKELKRTITEMKTMIDKLKKDLKSKESNYKKELSDKLTLQQKEFEENLNKKQEIIDNLFLEKKKLLYTFEDQSQYINKLERQDRKKMDQVQENYELELKRNRDLWEKTEKTNRKNWEEKCLKDIRKKVEKELEAPVQRIINENKELLIIQEDKHQKRLKEITKEVQTEYENKIKTLKEKFQEEKQEAIEHERTLSTQRVHNNAERLEDEFNENKKRWNSHLNAEILKMEELRQRDKVQFEDELKKIKERNRKMLEEKDNYYLLKIKELEKRQAEKAKMDFDDYKLKAEKEKNDMIEIKSKEMETKYQDLKKEIRSEAEKKAGYMAEKLSDNMINDLKIYKIEAEEKANLTNKQLKIDLEKLTLEVRDLQNKLECENMDKVLLEEKYNTLNRKLQDNQKDIVKKDKCNIDLTSTLKELNERYNNKDRDFQREIDDSESEYKLKIRKYETENKLLCEKVEHLKSHYENKFVQIDRQHQEKIVEFEDKLKVVLLKKEEIIEKLQNDVQTNQITIDKYEDLLSKQRKEFLS